MKEKNLRKEVLISNFLHSLKYRIKCNKDMIDKLYDDLYYANNDIEENYYLSELDKYENENDYIKNLIKSF
tara:strand:+ start:194 stop:406 length:213 start_codon:yes stop_codon:yes gene_type:complete